MLNSWFCHSRRDACGTGPKMTCGELSRCVLLSVRLCRTQRKTAPTGGSRSREREKAEWREEALRSVSGFMELCTSDPPPWIAICDHSFSFYLFYCPALFLRFPSSTPRMKVRELSGSWTCVCARSCAWAVRCAAHIGASAARSPRTWCCPKYCDNKKIILSAWRWHGVSAGSRHPISYKRRVRY